MAIRSWERQPLLKSNFDKFARGLSLSWSEDNDFYFACERRDIDFKEALEALSEKSERPIVRVDIYPALSAPSKPFAAIFEDHLRRDGRKNVALSVEGLSRFFRDILSGVLGRDREEKVRLLYSCYSQFNGGREPMSRVPAPIIFWAAPFAIPIIVSKMPDLFDWRKGFCLFPKRMPTMETPSVRAIMDLKLEK